MPKKPHKISSFLRSEICELFKRARTRVRYSGVRILTVPAAQKPGRILIVTPRASGNSPTRNRFKRRIRELFRELNLSDFQINFVVIVNKDGVSLPFAKLRQLLLSVIQKPHD
jgi:ribonuclease P protein component